ncbi:toxin-antitoxin system YwqK family antitoxin [bacterium SCSIO 12741]|nr:toxin-antitoxin system YwqK family antitoxin [bacterium SCSIO 12741]
MIKWVMTMAAFLIAFQGQSQLLEKQYEDELWAYYNNGLNSFLWSGIGGALKVGIDEYYVDDALRFNDAVFHDARSYNVETFSVIDFDDPINQSKYELIFEAGDTVNLMEALLYLGDNYGAYYKDHRRIRALTLNERDSIKDTCDLLNSRKMVLYEWWYMDTTNYQLRSFIRSYGIYDANDPKADRPAIWVDIVTMDPKLINRFQVKKGDGFVSIDKWLRSWDLERSEVLVMPSGYPDIRINDPFHNEMDAPIYRTLIEMRGQNLPVKKNRVKSKLVNGSYKNGERNGTWTYSKKGKVLAEFSYSKGIPDGSYSLYFEDGSLREKGTFKKGVKEGVCKAYYPDGNLKSERNFKNGKQNEKQSQYYTTGQLHSTWFVENGRPHGVYNQYNEDGTSRLKGRFLNGMIASEWTYQMYLEEVLCGFLQDDFMNGEVYKQVEQGAMDDCRADFVIRFVHDKSQGCYKGLCILPEPIGRIK